MALTNSDLFFINRSANTYKIEAHEIGEYLVTNQLPDGSGNYFVGDGKFTVKNTNNVDFLGPFLLTSANTSLDTAIDFDEHFVIGRGNGDVTVTLNFISLKDSLLCGDGSDSGFKTDNCDCLAIDYEWLANILVCEEGQAGIVGEGGCLKLNYCDDGLLTLRDPDGCVDVKTCAGIDISSGCIAVDISWVVENVICTNIDSGLTNDSGCLAVDFDKTLALLPMGILKSSDQTISFASGDNPGNQDLRNGNVDLTIDWTLNPAPHKCEGDTLEIIMDGTSNGVFNPCKGSPQQIILTSARGGIEWVDLSVTQHAPIGLGKLEYNNTNGVFSYTPPYVPAEGIQLTNLDVVQLPNSGTGLLDYNQGTGVFTYTPPAVPSDLTSLSVVKQSPSGNGDLTYNNSNGVFTFTPADLSSFNGGGSGGGGGGTNPPPGGDTGGCVNGGILLDVDNDCLYLDKSDNGCTEQSFISCAGINVRKERGISFNTEGWTTGESVAGLNINVANKSFRLEYDIPIDGSGPCAKGLKGVNVLRVSLGGASGRLFKSEAFATMGDVNLDDDEGPGYIKAQPGNGRHELKIDPTKRAVYPQYITEDDKISYQDRIDNPELHKNENPYQNYYDAAAPNIEEATDTASLDVIGGLNTDLDSIIDTLGKSKSDGGLFRWAKVKNSETGKLNLFFDPNELGTLHPWLAKGYLSSGSYEGIFFPDDGDLWVEGNLKPVDQRNIRYYQVDHDAVAALSFVAHRRAKQRIIDLETQVATLEARLTAAGIP